MMRNASALTGQLARIALFLLLPAAWAESAPFVVITPHVFNLRVGESRPFRLVNQDGQKQQNVTWTVSDPSALEISGNDDVTLTAKQPGEFHLTAQSSAGSDQINVTVSDGPLANGTIIWSEPALPGCKSGQMSQAVPTANGPDLYVESDCEDGHYVAAYTADGVQLWRRRITGAPTAATNPNPARMVVPSGPMIGMTVDVKAASICDLISVGADQQKVRDLLDQRKLTFQETGQIWTVEQTGSQCKLWFGDKQIVIKKRKTLVTD